MTAADGELPPGQRFDTLVEAFSDRPGVTPPDEPGRRGFGSTALKVSGSIFAMLADDHLVVKLPRSRVVALIQAGTGRPFSAGKRTVMKEWLVVTDVDGRTWRSIAEEAFAFVQAAPGRQ
ncbi:MAG: hypothetical protein DLM60_04755 [Pseudonocardiales bacterium]|nr:TfoX/Sxy family protein [Actinomycetota bacterium]PZS22328.1 MAG: hypothetical protein DLM60_04755 [Pseudonocardiales bacterium]